MVNVEPLVMKTALASTGLPPLSVAPGAVENVKLAAPALAASRVAQPITANVNFLFIRYFSVYPRVVRQCTVLS